MGNEDVVFDNETLDAVGAFILGFLFFAQSPPCQLRPSRRISPLKPFNPSSRIASSPVLVTCQ